MNPEPPNPDPPRPAFEIPPEGGTPNFKSVFHSPALWLGVLLLLPLLPVLIAPGGRVFGNYRGDNPAMFFYYNDFAGQCWRQGIMPLWNPYVMMGVPFLGEGQAAIFHPLSWLFAVLPPGVALNWVNALCFLLGGLFFYGWLRTLDLARDSSCCGALAWSFSNVMVSRIYAGHLTNMLIFFELPLLLLLWERWRQTRRSAFLAGLSLAYAAMILAAHPQFLSIFSMFFLLYVLLHAAPAMRTRAGLAAEGRDILRLGVFILLAVGIGMVQLWPMADFAGQSFRTQVDYDYCSSFSFVPENLLTLFAPNFFGLGREVEPRIYWGRGLFWEMWVYIGILPLLLAPLGVAAAPRARRIPLLICAGIFFIFALGRYTPLFPLLFETIPFFKMFRGPSKNIMITELCLVVFSAYGVQRLLHPPGGVPDRRGLRLGLLGGALVLVLAALLYLYFIPGHQAAGSHWHRLIAFTRKEKGGGDLAAPLVHALAGLSAHELLRTAVTTLLAMGLLALAWTGKWRKALAPLTLALILGDLLYVFYPLLVTTYNVSITSLPREIVAPLEGGVYPKRVIQTLTGPERSNAAMHHGFSSVSGYTGNALLRYNDYVNLAQNYTAGMAQVTDPINVYDPLTRFFAYDALILKKEELQAGMEVLGRTATLALVRAPDPFPRAFLAAAPQPLGSPREALVYVNKAGTDWLARPAIEEADPPSAPAPLAAGEGVRITAFSPNRVELEAQAAQPRVLVLNEAYEKNWTATVGGAAARVFPANYLFRGVVVPAGPSRVVFEYRPAAFRDGLAISLVSLAGLAGLGIGLRKRKGGKNGARSAEGSNAECGMRDAESGMKKKIAPRSAKKNRPGKMK